MIQNIKIISMKNLLEAKCFDFKKVIELCEEAFIALNKKDVLFPDKTSVILDERTQSRINCLPAGIISQQVFGMKWVSVFPENPNKLGLDNLTAQILLSDIKTGYPLALMEGSLCSNMRTAAVGAVAAKYLAKREPKTISFIGGGEQAKSHFLAMKSLFPSIKVCKVASRTLRTEELFIEQMKKFFPDVSYIKCNSNYEKSAKESDILVTAISGQEKILQADWIDNGTFYCHVAGLEDDFAVAQKADKIVCDNWSVVKHRTQTLSQMYKLGILSDSDIYANLDEIIIGKKTGRCNDNEFIYFNSVGLSFIDIYIANWMYQQVCKYNMGLNVGLKEKSMYNYAEDFVNV